MEVGMQRRRELRLRERKVLGGGVGVVAAGMALAVGAWWGQTSVTHAAAADQGAEGDAYGAAALVSVVGQSPVAVGPIAPSLSSQPGGAASAGADLVSCPSCLPPILQNTGAINTRTAATLTSVTNNCTTASGFPTNGNVSLFSGTLTGGSACASVAGASLIASAPGSDILDADVIQTQSVTQSCTATPIGNAGIVGLKVLGTPIPISALPVNLGPNTDLGNILPALGPVGTALKTTLQTLGVTVILNEEHYDNVGHGLTVNGVHVIISKPIGTLAAGDVVISHSHSEATCAGVVPTVPPNVCSPPGSGCTPPVTPVITKDDSTHTAVPGQTISYTITIQQKLTQCGNITQVIDTLPPGFTFVKAISGPLGNPVVASPAGRQTLSWINLQGFSGLSDPVREVISVVIGASVTPGLTYFNDVDVTDAFCGTVHGTDGGIHVGPLPTAAPSNAVAAATPTPGTPNTAAASATGAGGTGLVVVVGGGLLAFAGACVLLRRLRRRYDAS